MLHQRLHSLPGLGTTRREENHSTDVNGAAWRREPAHANNNPHQTALGGLPQDNQIPEGSQTTAHSYTGQITSQQTDLAEDLGALGATRLVDGCGDSLDDVSADVDPVGSIRLQELAVDVAGLLQTTTARQASQAVKQAGEKAGNHKTSQQQPSQLDSVANKARQSHPLQSLGSCS